jgi:orotate phosphoribosyltransferase
MSTQAGSAKEVARMLLEAECVSARTGEPFRLPSGWASPVYMDCRRLAAFPPIRRELVRRTLDLLREREGVAGVECVVGCEASGIAMAAWLADALDLPMQFIRKRARGNVRIEGPSLQGRRVLLVDDLMAAGVTKLDFVAAIHDAGAELRDLSVTFDYGTFGAEQSLAAHGVRTHALATWADVLAALGSSQAFDDAARVELADFLTDPRQWSLEHGGKGPF